MTHKLRISVQLDIDLHWVRMDVHGCLTEENCRALLPIVRRSYRILQEPNVVIDATGARHIDRECMDILGLLGIAVPANAPAAADRPSDQIQGVPAGTCVLIVPEVLPDCPAQGPQPRGSRE